MTMTPVKKTLLASSALAAVGLVGGPAFAEDGKISLSVGGYYQNFLSFVSQDNDAAGLNANGQLNDYNPINVRHEGEIHFKGTTTLDNGLQVGFDAQLEAITQSDQMDETYMWFSGNWGRAVLGSENSAPYLMSYSAPSAGLGLNSPNFFIFSTTNSAPTSGFLNIPSDANKITYFTPRMAGFQLGASYTPNIDNRSGDRQTFGLNTDNNVGAHDKVISIGGNFVQSFDAADIAISAGYEQAALQANSAASPSLFDDISAWSVGASVGFSGFTIGGSYANADIEGFGAGNKKQIFYDVGLQYGSGPWKASLTYARGENEFTAGGSEDKRDMFELGASYKLSPGITVVGSGQYMKEETAGSSTDIKGWGLALGTKLSF
ncbi:porin [Rhodovibrionaceae bacterium A322]